MSEIEHKILAVIQNGLPKTVTPYADMAEKAGIMTDELLDVLGQWKADGKMRRIGAVVSHYKMGIPAGAMVVWKVPSERVEEVGNILASFPEVTHAYERTRPDGWPYNFYTMVHGQSSEDVDATVARMSQACGVSNCRQLRTVRELKKVPPTYIINNN